MVITLFVYILGLLLSTIALVLPVWQLWPEVVFTSFENIILSLMGLNNILMVVPEIFDALTFFLRFLGYFGIFLIVRKVFNYFRGTGQGI